MKRVYRFLFFWLVGAGLMIWLFAACDGQIPPQETHPTLPSPSQRAAMERESHPTLPSPSQSAAMERESHPTLPSPSQSAAMERESHPTLPSPSQSAAMEREETLPHSPLPTSHFSPTAMGTETPRRSHYSFAVRFDYLAHTLGVTETLVYVNNTSASLTELLVVVEADRREGSFALQGLQWGDGEPLEDYILEEARLRIPLRQALAPYQSLSLHIQYSLDIPFFEAGQVVYGPLNATARQANLGDWYPYIPPLDAEAGWLVYEPSGVGENQVYDLADFEVNIEVVDAPPGLVIAASSWGQQAGDRYHFLLEGGRNFAWSASPEYVVAQTVIGSALITSYAFPEDARQGQALLQVSADAVALYNELFAPYPHTSLAVVESGFFDGLEYDGLYFLGSEYFAAYSGAPTDYLTILGAHETAHQWWYGLVGSDQAWQPWLDEALCTYSERLFYERYAPELLPWWWNYRVDRFDPQGAVDSTIYDLAGFRLYTDAVYLRGARLLEDLRIRVGDEAFFAALKAYAAREAGRIARPDDFFAALRAQTGQDFSDIVARYFQEGSVP